MKRTKKESSQSREIMQMNEFAAGQKKVGLGYVLVVDIAKLRAGDDPAAYVTSGTRPTNKECLVIPIPDDVLARDLPFVLCAEMNKVCSNLSVPSAEITNIRLVSPWTKTAHTESRPGVKNATTRATKNGKQNR
jgi:hypothetical protein